MQKWNFYKERIDPLLRISRYLRILHPYIFSFKLCVIAYIRLSNPLLSIGWLVTARWEEQLRKNEHGEERYEISYGRMIIRCGIDGTHGHGAPASGHWSSWIDSQETGSARSRQREEGMGGGITRSPRFFSPWEKEHRGWPGPRLTGNGSLRVESGRVSSSLLSFVYVYSLSFRERERDGV